MMDYTAVSAYPPTEGADKRKAEMGKPESGSPFANRPGAASALPVNNNGTFQIYQPAQQDYSTFQFRQPLAPPRPGIPQSPQQQITPLGLLPANLAQMANGNLEKLAGQIMSFFNGNRKEKPSEEERLNRQLNDAFGGGLLGEVLKVEEAAKGQMQDGGDS
ncbi:hypothetical protein [Vampirovibrio sp.]|uniref:hypothetical protein n=1 Tax=Vampirovibrio sp. TaxID=2717857 RepID=UPI003593F1CC